MNDHRPQLDSLADLGASELEARKIRSNEALAESTKTLASKMPPPESEWWVPKPAVRERMWTAIATAVCTIVVAGAGWIAARLSPSAPAPEPRVVIIERDHPIVLTDAGAEQ